MDKNLETIVNRHFGSERGNPILEKANAVYLDLIPLAKDESKDRKKNLVDGIYPFVAIYLNLRQNTPPPQWQILAIGGGWMPLF